MKSSLTKNNGEVWKKHCEHVETVNNYKLEDVITILKSIVNYFKHDFFLFLVFLTTLLYLPLLRCRETIYLQKKTKMWLESYTQLNCLDIDLSEVNSPNSVWIWCFIVADAIQQVCQQSSQLNSSRENALSGP